MSATQPLRQCLETSGLLDAVAFRQDDALRAAREAGLLGVVADCDRARSRSAVLRAVVKAVDFPEFFGSDLDAFYDCLCDTVLDQKTGLLLWFHRLHSGDPALEEDAGRIQEICDTVAQFAQNNDRRFVYALDHAGRHPEPEPDPVPQD